MKVDTSIAAPPVRKSLEPYLKDEVEFYPHQIEAIRHIALMDAHILADDMGLGKSLAALTIYCIALKMNKAVNCIIVCPTTLRENWADEIERFTRLPALRLGEVVNPARRGHWKKISPTDRNDQLLNWLDQDGPRILIINYEQLTSKYHTELFQSKVFDFAIFDEAHYIKTHDSLRTKAALKLKSKKSILLTGTPMLNQVNDLWPLLHKVDPRTFPKYWQFVNRYCVMGGFGGKQIVGAKNTIQLRQHLARVMTRRLKKNVLSLLEPNYITNLVGLSEVQQTMYDTAAEELLLEYPESGLPPGEIANAMIKFMRLLQICATPFAVDPSFPDVSLKLDRAIEIAKEFADRNEKLVIFTAHRRVITALEERAEKAKLGPFFSLHGGIKQEDRVPTVKLWGSQSGFSMITSMYQVGGQGLNMVEASTVLRTDRLFSPGMNRQAVDRVNRIGQTEPVQVIDLITRGTVEHRVQDILRFKEKLNVDIIEGSTGMRSLLEKLKEQMKDDM